MLPIFQTSEFIKLGINERLGSFNDPIHLCGVGVALSVGLGHLKNDNQIFDEFSNQLKAGVGSTEWLLIANTIPIWDRNSEDPTSRPPSSQTLSALLAQLILPRVLSRCSIPDNQITEDADNTERPADQLVQTTRNAKPSPSKNCLITTLDPITRKPIECDTLLPDDEDEFFKDLKPLLPEQSLPARQIFHLAPVTNPSAPDLTNNPDASLADVSQLLDIPVSLRQCLNILKCQKNGEDNLEEYWRVRRALLSIPMICE